jgi:hypothetical protein
MRREPSNINALYRTHRAPPSPPLSSAFISVHRRLKLFALMRHQPLSSALFPFNAHFRHGKEFTFTT